MHVVLLAIELRITKCKPWYREYVFGVDISVALLCEFMPHSIE